MKQVTVVLTTDEAMALFVLMFEQRRIGADLGAAFTKLEAAMMEAEVACDPE